MDELDTRSQAEFLARESFHSPGIFNESKFIRDFALFIILRKQCIRFLKTGQINHRLAANNAIIAINSFGSSSVVKIVNLIFATEQIPVINAILHFIGVEIKDEYENSVWSQMIEDNFRYNIG